MLPIDPILKGIQIYHNYIRPHMSLEGKTPSELAGIKVNGDNKWKTFQNVSREPAQSHNSYLCAQGSKVKNPFREWYHQLWD